MKFNFLKAVTIANLPRKICNHLHGPDHPVSHRMWVGVAIMMGGVFLAHAGASFPRYFAVLMDTTGYAIHALGATPFIEWLLEE